MSYSIETELKLSLPRVEAEKLRNLPFWQIHALEAPEVLELDNLTEIFEPDIQTIIGYIEVLNLKPLTFYQ